MNFVGVSVFKKTLANFVGVSCATCTTLMGLTKANVQILVKINMNIFVFIN